jgi:uncharacterized repeat protein (TIGR02543 family)
MKKYLYLLAITLINILTPAEIYAQSSEEIFSGGFGTEESPYKITKESDLILMRDYCGSMHADKHFRLMNNITLYSTAWTPIGDITYFNDKKFTGYFHGGGHTISGLRANERSSNYVGLFGYIEGTVDSLYIKGTSIKGGQYVGGLAGYNAGKIIFCHTEISVDGISLSLVAYAGGLVGYNKGIVQSSSAKGDGDIKVSGSSAAYAGGLIGYSDNSDITNCFVQGTINIEALAFGIGIAYSGGLVGYLNSGSVIDCYAMALPSATNGTTRGQTGAVVGYNNGNISNCYYNTSNTGTMPAAGNNANGTSHGQSSAGMTTKDVYVDWDFNSVWGIKVNDYPYLRENPLRVESLTVNPETLTPAFHYDTYNYTVDVKNIANITVGATVDLNKFQGATISGTGSNELKNGKNSIPVTVEHDGGKLVYTIDVHLEYELSFDAQGGTVDPSKQIIKSSDNKLPVPVRTGYDFKEWNTKPAGDSISFDDLTVQNASGINTLYAQWVPKEYTLKFDAGADGSVSQSSKPVKYGVAVGELPEPTRTGYDFVDWHTQMELYDNKDTIYTQDTVYRIASDKTLYAEWAAKTFKLNFDARGGNVDKESQEVTYNEVVGDLPLPDRPGYSFDGWNTKSDGSGDTYDKQTRYTATTDITVYAQWTMVEYTLSFDTQSELPNPGQQTVNYGGSVGLLPDLGKREHYTFTGWNTKGDGSGEFYNNNDEYKIESDATFYAIWTGDPYKISFDINYSGGINHPLKTVNYGSAVGELPEFTRKGWSGEWNTKDDGSGETYTSSSVYYETQNITLYANWTKNQYKLIYDAQGGKVSPSEKIVDYDTKVGPLPTPSRENYVFIEWNTLANGTGDTYNADKTYLVDANTTIYAQWEGVSSELIFDAQEGTVSPSKKDVYYGSAVGVLPDPVRTGYIFKGWFTGTNGGGTQYTSTTAYNIIGNTSLYAKWERETYNLIFDSNGSTDRSPDDRAVTFGLAVGDLPIPTPNPAVPDDKFDFDGWNTRPDGTGDMYQASTIYNVAGNTTLYAQWKGEPYTLTFKPNNGIVSPTTMTVYYNTAVGTLPVPTRDGYTFTGWKDINNKEYTEKTIATDDAELTAQWEINNYTLTFNAGGGTVTPEKKTVTYGKEVGDLPTPVRAGYDFKGWYSGTGGSGTKYETTTKYNTPGSTPLHAKWTCTITFDENKGDGTVLKTKVATVDSVIGPIYKPAPASQYYTFKEWNTEKKGKGITYNENTVVAGSTTLYAIWTGQEYTLYLNPDGGKIDGQAGTKTKTVNYGSEVGTLPTPIRGGYTFMGWYDGEPKPDNLYTEKTIYEKTVGLTIKAHWEKRVYSINFYTYKGGTFLKYIENIQYGDIISSYGSFPDVNDLEREHYTLAPSPLRWNTMPDGKDGLYVTGDTKYYFEDNITLWLQWIGDPATLTFNANYPDGAPDMDDKVDVRYGSKIGELPVVTRYGYNLVNWNTSIHGDGKGYNSGDECDITKDIKLFANWEPKTCVLHFDTQGGQEDYTDRSQAVKYNAIIGSGIFPPDPSRLGYQFAGWYTTSNGAGLSYTMGSTYLGGDNTTLYANWTPNAYKLFLIAGEDKVEEEDMRYGESFQLDRPSSDGYKFEQWNTSSDGLGKSYLDGANYTHAETHNVNLYAQWTPNQYEITFNTNGGGSTPSRIYVTYGTSIGTLPTSTRENYTFNGWKDKDDNSYEDETPYLVANNTTLYAQWTGNPYKIIFDTGDDSKAPPAPVTVNYGSEVETLPVPTRTGYYFTFWTDADDSPYTAPYTYLKSGDLTLYAHWTENNYEIVFNLNYDGGETLGNQSVKYNSKVTTLPTVEREGYVFKGWKDGSGTTYSKETVYTETSNTTLYAQWSALNYTISFNTNYTDGINPSSQNVDYDASVELPELSRTGYTLKEWNTDINGNGTAYVTGTIHQIAKDITLYAQWEINRYYINFDVNHASDITLPETAIAYGAKVGTLPSVERTGYTLSGWNTKKDGSGTTYIEDMDYMTLSDITLYAQWSQNIYKISFDTQGGTTESNHSVRYNVVIGDLPVPVRTGYTFGGWFAGANGSDEEYTNRTVYKKTDDMILYAKWTVNQYTLILDAQGGESVRNTEVTYNAPVGELTTPARKGYTFGGWYSDTEGNGKQYTLATIYDIVGNTTLYAYWTINNYVLTFDAQGGETVGTIESVYNSIVTLPQPTRTGHTFNGWNTSRDGSGVTYSTTMQYTKDNDVTLYAQWSVNAYTLTFDVQGGNSIPSQSATYGKPAGTLPVPVRTGYIFGGWFTGTGGGGNEYTTTTIYSTAGNTTLYAFWTANHYILAFDLNCDECAELNPESREVAYGSAVGMKDALPLPKRNGYKFNSWNTATDGSGTTYISTTHYVAIGNITLYAQWSADVYTISFEANYLGSLGKPENPAHKNVVYGSAVGTLPVLTRTGYIFTGWNTAENGGGKTYVETTVYTLTDNTKLYAQWTDISCTVNFIGDNVNIDPQNMLYGAKAVKPSDPTLQGYVFGGWYKDNDLWDFNSPVTGDILLKAAWISSNSELQSLTLNAGRLVPDFKSETTDYRIVVSYDVTTLNVIALQRHSGASVTGDVGNKPLVVGDNIVKITVTAQDGVNRTIYTLLVTRADHILVNEANLLNFSANGRNVNIEGNNLEYVAACGETSFTIDLNASPYASIAIDGEPYNKEDGQVIEMTGDVTTVKIHVVSETGTTQDYVLKANASLNKGHLYYRRWNLLGINANPKENGGYEVLGVRWYRHDGTFAGDKGYIETSSSYSQEYAEIQTVQKEGWRRVCNIPIVRSMDKVTVYPNPVLSNESVTLELPERYVGGTLNVYNTIGMLIKSGLPLTLSTNTVDVTGFASGIYLFNITGKDGNHHTVKVIVE